MDMQKTHPGLRRHILSSIRAWHRNGTHNPRRAQQGSLALALTMQDNIGWYNFLLGRVAKPFEEIQHAHYLAIQSKKTGFRWTVALILKLQEVAWDMWEHRNSILHKDPDNHHTRVLTQEADLAIHREFSQGTGTLRRKDHILLRSLQEVLTKSLPDKRRWLDSVTGARKAWHTRQEQCQPTYDNERAQMARQVAQWRAETQPPL